MTAGGFHFSPGKGRGGTAAGEEQNFAGTRGAAVLRPYAERKCLRVDAAVRDGGKL